MMSERPVFEMERMFDAPPPLVWRTWTEEPLLSRWYGPGVETAIHELDVRVGGRWLNEMRMGGRSMFQRMDYTAVAPPKRLEMLMANTDGDWQVVANPMMPDWPKVLLTVVTFQAVGDRTRQLLTWSPHEASASETAAFAAAMAGLGKGWGAGMEVLAEVLAELRG